MKKSLKQCPRCGYVHISKQERAIIDMMPTSSDVVRERLNISQNHANVVMDRLVKFGILIKSEKNGRYIIYDKSEDAYDLMNVG